MGVVLPGARLVDFDLSCTNRSVMFKLVVIAMNFLHLALSCDDKYAQYAAVAIYSAAKTLSTSWALDVVVIHSGLCEDSINLLLGSVRERGSVRFHYVAPNTYRDLPVMEHWSTAMYYRFAISDAVPNGARCVYLDCDVLVQRSLHELVGIDMKGAALGVVEEPSGKRARELGLGRKYFNSGVLLYDLDAWKRLRLTDRSIKIAIQERHRLVCPDQDVLNMAVGDDIYFLNPSWNVQLAMFARPRYWDALKSPAVIHFTTNVKPWNREDPHPYAPAYRALAAEIGVVFSDYGRGCGLGYVRVAVRWLRRFAVYFAFSSLVTRA